MNLEGCLVELKPNRLLLDPSFGGYKLNLDSIPIYRKAIDSGIRVVQPGDNQYSFYHVKLFSLHNHLYVNSYLPSNVYFIDNKWKVFKIITSPPYQAFSFKEVFQIPQTRQDENECYNVSIVFPSFDMVVISDGYGMYYLAKVLGQEDGEIWEAQNPGNPFREEAIFVLSDARMELNEDKKVLHVLLLFIEERSKEQKDVKGSLFQTKLKWRTFIQEGLVWQEYHNKELYVDGSVNYVALEAGCEGLLLISDKSPKWVYDTENPIQHYNDMEVGPISKPKLYNWTQTEEEITITVPLQEEIQKPELSISVEDLEINVKIKQKEIITGKFYHRVNKDLTTWSLGKQKLEIQLTKYENGLMWKSLIPGDDGGEEVVDPELIKSVHERLAHLCSDKMETSSPTFNSQQLEECDAVSCDTTSLFRINGETHTTTHEVSLASLQWLFKVSCEPGSTPAICVRHDVDACVWQFHKPENEMVWPHEHIGTFSAFGYVQASKTQKFLASPPNLSYVVVCEASHRIYIYRQPSPLTTELKNRHTGKKVETISKQQLVNLEAKDQILGVHATNNLLFVLLENSVCVLSINPM